MNFRWLNAVLWGNSVALSWMWGLGLFFSVQMTFMFGLQGLLMFAIPNALGLMLFGLLTHNVASSHSGGQESLAIFFDKFSKPFRLILYLYQIVALSLTVFALVKYLFVPLELAAWPLLAIYLVLIVFVILAAGCLFGEEFGIAKIKISHAMLGGLLVLCVGTILFNLHPLSPQPFQWKSPFEDEWRGARFFGYAIPLVIGLLVGPWLDLQHWQRAIQIHREKTSIRLSYFFGGSIFFLMLLFHGCLAMWVMRVDGSHFVTNEGLDKFNYAHDLVTRYFQRNPGSEGIMRMAYFGFLGICALTTLDSGYIALKWFLEKNVEKSDNMLISLIPKQILGSPVPTFIVIGVHHAHRHPREAAARILHGVLRLVLRRLRRAGHRPLLCAEFPTAAAADPDVHDVQRLAGDLRLRLHEQPDAADDPRRHPAARLRELARLQRRPAARRHRESRRSHRGRLRDPRHQGHHQDRRRRHQLRGRRARGPPRARRPFRGQMVRLLDDRHLSPTPTPWATSTSACMACMSEKPASCSSIPRCRTST